jgi:hypothetical protein
MGNVLEDIKEVRKEVDELFSSIDVSMLSDERIKAAGIEKKLAEIDKEISIFFSGQI